MKENFEKAYNRVRVYEGGNVDDPHDPGGRTSRGVIQRVYNGYRKNKGLPEQDVYKASEAEIREIYRTQYWDAIHGDELPDGIDFFVYDGAVNSGPSQASKWLQRAIGTKDDGHIGQATLGMLKTNTDHDLIVGNMADQRMNFLRNLKTFSRYGKGWTGRVNNAEKISQAWADGSIGPEPIKTASNSGVTKKAEKKDAQETPITQENGMATTAGASAGSVVIDTIQGTSTTLQGFSELTYVKYILIALAVAGFAYTIYSIWKTRQIKEATA